MTEADLLGYLGKNVLLVLRDGRSIAGRLVGEDARFVTGSSFAIEIPSPEPDQQARFDLISSAEDVESLQLQDPPEDDAGEPSTGAE